MARVRASLSVVVAFVLPLSSPSLAGHVPTAHPSVRDEEAAFPPGIWQGRALYKGTVQRTGLFGFADANVTFDLTVEGDEVTDGTMKVSGHGEVDTPAGPGDVYMSGTLELSGTATSVLAEGDVDFAGTANGIPIQFGGPVRFAFSPRFASCTRVFGDLVSESVRAGLPGGVHASAPFVAFRARYGSQYKELLDEYETVVRSLVNLAAHPEAYSLGDFEELVDAVEDLNARILELVPCVPLPPGLKSTAPSEFDQLFRQVVSQVLDFPEKLTAQEVLALLAAGVRTGALIDSTEAQALLDKFEDVLLQKLDQAEDSGDVQTVDDIAVGAKQAGLTELAEDAEAAAKRLSGGGCSIADARPPARPDVDPDAGDRGGMLERSHVPDAQPCSVRWAQPPGVPDGGRSDRGRSQRRRLRVAGRRHVGALAGTAGRAHHGVRHRGGDRAARSTHRARRRRAQVQVAGRGGCDRLPAVRARCAGTPAVGVGGSGDVCLAGRPAQAPSPGGSWTEDRVGIDLERRRPRRRWPREGGQSPSAGLSMSAVSGIGTTVAATASSACPAGGA